MSEQRECQDTTIEEHWRTEEATIMRMFDMGGFLTPDRIDIITEYRSLLRKIFYRGATSALCTLNTTADKSNLLAQGVWVALSRNCRKEMEDHLRELQEEMKE